MMRIAVLDDNKDFLSLFLAQLKEEIIASRIEAKISGFSEVRDFENSIAQSQGADIVFLDILLPHQNGVKIATLLQAKYPEARVVFMSAVADTASDIFDASPCYFLVKPISREKLHAALTAALHREKDDVLVLETKGQAFQLKKALLEYVECNGRRLSFHSNREVFSMPGRLSQITEQLGSPFLRCHKSFTVNLASVRRLEKQEFVMASQARIPISRKNAAGIKSAFFSYLGRTASDIQDRS